MHYKKLVRDKIPEILDEKGIAYEIYTADETEFRNELIIKLEEEVNEFISDQSNEELADIMEVIEAIKTLPEFSNVEEIRLEKKEKRGGFDKKIIAKGDDGR